MNAFLVLRATDMVLDQAYVPDQTLLSMTDRLPASP
ncbi:MAG: hypothetical protein ACJAYU_004828 [Bradymonadia bacterium]|jgi:hypothetical protein